MKRKLSPIISLIILIILVTIISVILSVTNFSASQTTIIEGSLETSIVLINNIFTVDGITTFLNSLFTNELIQTMILFLMSVACTSILYSSGLLKHLFSPLRRLKPSLITFIVVFISVISTIIGSYSFVILLPLVTVLYKYLNKSPVLGVITVFLGITLGYGTGIFYNYDSYILGTLTEASATIEVAASYRYDLYSSIYIMIASSVAISFIITYLIEQNISKKVVVNEVYSDELVTTKKSLILTILTFLSCIVLVILGMTPVFNSILLDNEQTIFVAKIFSENAPFNNSFIFIYLLICSLCGLVYGFMSKNFKNNLDYSFGFSKISDNIIYLFILIFLSSILIHIITWTNLGVVITNSLITLLSTLEITGIPLIIITFILVILMSILMPNTIEKWVLISPIVIPLFVRANLTPDFAQFVFQAADSVGKIITPIFVFFPIMLGFIQMNNINQRKITLLGTIKLIWPVIIAMVVFWLVILIVWYIAGLPLGIDTLTTL